MFLEKMKKSKIDFVEKDFAAEFLKHNRKIENLKLYTMAYLVFQYFNTGDHITQKRVKISK
jgi:hypothetical protein